LKGKNCILKTHTDLDEVRVYENYMDVNLANRHTQKCVDESNLGRIEKEFHKRMNSLREEWVNDLLESKRFKKHHPSELREHKYLKGERVQFQQYGDACILRHHFVGVYGDMRDNGNTYVL